MSYEPHSILAIDMSPFGRSLALLPAIKSLRAAYGKTFIAVAANRGLCELLTAQGAVDEVIDVGAINAGEQGMGSSFRRMGQLLRKARRLGRDFEIVLDFTPRLETQAFMHFFLKSRTITPSKISNILDSILGRKAGGRWASDHAAECESVLRQLGLAIQEPARALEVPEDEHTKFEETLARHGSRGGEPIIILHAAKAGGAHGWPVERFLDLASRLVNNFGARIVAVDDPASDSFTDAVGKLLPGKGIKMDSPSALELAAACARGSVVVTDDAGVASLCEMVGTPVLEIADAPASPRAQSHRIVQGSSLARVDVEEVYALACEMLRESRTVSLFHR